MCLCMRFSPHQRSFREQEGGSVFEDTDISKILGGNAAKATAAAGAGAAATAGGGGKSGAPRQENVKTTYIPVFFSFPVQDTCLPLIPRVWEMGLMWENNDYNGSIVLAIMMILTVIMITCFRLSLGVLPRT